jgi:hypothetical protein
MSTSIIINIGELKLSAELNDSPSAEKLKIGPSRSPFYSVSGYPLSLYL